MTTSAKDPLRDFRNFLFAIWKHLGLPAPTGIQYDIAGFLMDTSIRRKVVEAFRGIGKSWITDAYVCYCLYCNPNERILLVSASAQKAETSLRFIKNLITNVAFLRHLAPSDDERNTISFFDVKGSSPAEAPSVRAAGITGQITGSRATKIIADDVEISKNSLTPLMRERLAEAIKEFEAILVPSGSIIFLGTPQTEYSIYNILPERGYVVRIWPARFPTKSDLETTYGQRISPWVTNLIDERAGQPTEPTRFHEQELFERELSYGRSGFRLQYMLDTRLNDGNKYPLKLSDFIVLDCDNSVAPQKVIWGSLPNLRLKDMPIVGLSTDGFFLPQFVSQVNDWLPYQGAVLAIDPAGRGKDETAYCVLKTLNGYMFLLDAGGMLGGSTPSNLEALANIAASYDVNKVLLEVNFGDGMFAEILAPYLINTHPVSIEEIRSTTSKEKRIIDTLEPLLNQHRIVLNKSLITKDFQSADSYELAAEDAHTYQLFWQMTRLTSERGCLPHDDRIDCLAMAAAHFKSHARIEADKAIKIRQNKLQDAAIQEFLKANNALWGGKKKTWGIW